MNNKKVTLDRSDLTAILALVVSFISLGIGLYETRIMREEKELMQSQQKASVWPFVKKIISYQLDEEKFSVSLSIENKGVGPALLKEIQIQDKYSKDSIPLVYQDVYDIIVRDIPDSMLATAGVSINFNLDEVISPGEKRQILAFESPRFKNDDAIIYKAVRFNFSFCYSSIYGDSWMIDYGKNSPVSVENCSN